MNPQTSPPANRHCAQVIASAAKQSEATSPIQPKKLKDKLLKQIINYLRLNHALDAAFLISKQTHTHLTNNSLTTTPTHQTRTFTYTLLIFTNKSVIALRPPNPPKAEKEATPNEVGVKQPRHSTPPLLGRGGRGVRTQPNPAELSDLIYNHTQKQAKVYLIMMDAAKASEKLDISCNFLVYLIKNSPQIFSIDNHWLRFKHSNIIAHPIIDKEINHQWSTRFKRATYLHSLTVYNEMEQNPVASFEVLQKVIEQTCLGLIYVFWQYKPSYTGLPYLLHLCSLFTELPSKIFNTNTFENHQILHNLTHATNNLKYKTRHNITQKQIDKARKKCHTFLTEAEAIVTKHRQTNNKITI